MTANVTIRVAQLSDAPELVRIYAPYVEKTAISFEYTVPTVDEFRQRMAVTLKKYPYLVAVRDERIVGYAYVGPFNGRAAYDWAVETSIYVTADQRHAGIGGRLYAALEMICREMNIIGVYACIGYPRGDEPFLTKNSAQFHQHLGFQLVGRFHQCGYKLGHWYDMIWMEKMLASHPAKPAAVKNFNDIKTSIATKLKSVK